MATEGTREVATSEAARPAGWLTIGHDAARTRLLRALRAGRLAHAYLITGPERVGRRSLALDLARAVNCEGDEVNARPCGGCRPCQRISRGIHADVRVIDPNTPIESEKARGSDDAPARRVIRKGHVDDLQHRASLKPFEGRSHVFVIDGAELMQAPAANALLKTLEEPESQVLLILLTSAPSELTDTIVSRCQRIDLRPVPADVIERHLAESLGADPAMARILARASGGRPGWALSAVTDPTAIDGRRQSVMRILGALTGSLDDRFKYARNLAAAHRKDREAIHTELALWTAWWRDTLLLKHGIEGQIAHEDFKDQLAGVAGEVESHEIVAAIRAIAATSEAVERNAMTPLVFEVLMLDMPRIDPGAVPSAGAAVEGEEWQDEE